MRLAIELDAVKYVYARVELRSPLSPRLNPLSHMPSFRCRQVYTSIIFCTRQTDMHRPNDVKSHRDASVVANPSVETIIVQIGPTDYGGHVPDRLCRARSSGYLHLLNVDGINIPPPSRQEAHAAANLSRQLQRRVSCPPAEDRGTSAVVNLIIIARWLDSDMGVSWWKFCLTNPAVHGPFRWSQPLQTHFTAREVTALLFDRNGCRGPPRPDQHCL